MMPLTTCCRSWTRSCHSWWSHPLQGALWGKGMARNGLVSPPAGGGGGPKYPEWVPITGLSPSRSRSGRGKGRVAIATENVLRRVLLGLDCRPLSYRLRRCLCCRSGEGVDSHLPLSRLRVSRPASCFTGVRIHPLHLWVGLGEGAGRERELAPQIVPSCGRQTRQRAPQGPLTHEWRRVYAISADDGVTSAGSSAANHLPSIRAAMANNPAPITSAASRTPR